MSEGLLSPLSQPMAPTYWLSQRDPTGRHEHQQPRGPEESTRTESEAQSLRQEPREHALHLGPELAGSVSVSRSYGAATTPPSRPERADVPPRAAPRLFASDSLSVHHPIRVEGTMTVFLSLVMKSASLRRKSHAIRHALASPVQSCGNVHSHV